MLVAKCERKQLPGPPGWMGTARVERLIEEPEDPRHVGGTQRGCEAISNSAACRESAGPIGAEKRGNSRGAKRPYQLHVS